MEEKMMKTKKTRCRHCYRALQLSSSTRNLEQRELSLSYSLSLSPLSRSFFLNFFLSFFVPFLPKRFYPFYAGNHKFMFYLVFCTFFILISAITSIYRHQDIFQIYNRFFLGLCLYLLICLKFS